MHSVSSYDTFYYWKSEWLFNLALKELEAKWFANKYQLIFDKYRSYIWWYVKDWEKIIDTFVSWKSENLMNFINKFTGKKFMIWILNSLYFLQIDWIDKRMSEYFWDKYSLFTYIVDNIDNIMTLPLYNNVDREISSSNEQANTKIVEENNLLKLENEKLKSVIETIKTNIL